MISDCLIKFALMSISVAIRPVASAISRTASAIVPEVANTAGTGSLKDGQERCANAEPAKICCRARLCPYRRRAV